MLTAWDLEAPAGGSRTRTAQVLLDAVTYPVAMDTIINDRARRTDALIENLFVPTQEPAAEVDEEPPTLGNGLADAPHAGPRAADRASTRLGPARFVTGVVENVIYDKGFGFIRPDTGGDSLFFHATDVEGGDFAALHAADAVRFIVAPNPRDGRPNARRVSRTASSSYGSPGRN